MKNLWTLFGRNPRNPNNDYYILRHCEDQSNDTDTLNSVPSSMPMRFHWKVTLVIAFAITAIFGIHLSTRASTRNTAPISEGFKGTTRITDNNKESQRKAEVFVHQEIQSNCQGSECSVPSSKTQDDEYAAYFVPAKEKINPFYHSFLKDGRTICRETSPPYLMILVPTAPSRFRERAAIRSTWGSIAKRQPWPSKQLSVKVKIVFLLGAINNETVDTKVENENRIFRDIIQGDFLDSYNNLPIKILLGLHWISHFCSDVRYILKADDDMFVNIPVLLDVINEYDNRLGHNGFILGNINSDAKVRRTGRWAVSKEAYPFPHFPPYAYGNTYVISANIAARLFSTSEYMPYVPVEDAYITGILAKTVEAQHYNEPGFAYWLEHKPSYCDFIEDKKISATKVSPDYMYYIWEKLHSLEVEC